MSSASQQPGSSSESDAANAPDDGAAAETSFDSDQLVSFDPETPFWDRFYMVAPLVVIGTKDDDTGAYNLAPKHMAAPMGWQNFYGFVCTPRHKTYRNAKRTGTFTVSFPRPDQLVLTSLAAAPRDDAAESDGPGTKPTLDQLPTQPAQVVDGILLQDAYLFLECEIDRIVDDLGENSLLIGRIAAVHVHKDALRVSEQDDQEAIRDHPLLAYLPPNRYATIDASNAFPFPAGFQK